MFAIILVTEGNWYGKRDDDAENIFLRYLEQTKLPQKQNTDDRLKTLLLRTLIGKVNAHQSEEELDKPKTRF